MAGVLLYGLTKNPSSMLLFPVSLPVFFATSQYTRHRARTLCGPACVGGGPAVLHLQRGFGFLSEPFAVETARLNPTLLLSAPEVVQAQLDLPRAILLPPRTRDD